MCWQTLTDSNFYNKTKLLSKITIEMPEIIISLLTFDSFNLFSECA